MYSLDEINKKMAHSLVANLGITITKASATEVEATMPVDERTCQPFGYLHGGASLALAETLAGIGSIQALGENEFAMGAQVTGNHVMPAPIGATLYAKAKILHQGHRTHLWNVNIYNTTGELVSTCRVLNSILRRQ